MARIFGKVWLLDGKWHMEGEPHLLIRAKRIFARIWAAEHGVVTLKNTDEVCRDIDWFLERYPMEMAPGDKRILKRGSDRHVETMATLDDLIDQNYTGREFKMGLPPRDYQKLAASILLERGFLLLADQLGTGKTVSALAALTDKRTLPAIVVTLTGAMPMQWQSMAWRFMPSLTTHIINKGTPYELPKIKARGPDVIIINYHKLTGWAETLAAYGKSIIFDECQELRRAGSKKYEGAKYIARQMKFKLGCSGTPIFNLGGEIWNVVDVLQEDALGTWPEFVREWCYGERSYDGKAPAVRDPKALGSYLRSEHIMLRRTRKDVGRELPPLTTIPQYIDSDESALDSVKDSASQLAKIIMSNEKVAGWDRMKAAEEFSQVMRQATGVAKASYVADFIRLIVDGDDEPVVVFAWHRAVYDILLAKLNDLAPAMYTGTESVVKKQEALDRFTKGETKVLLMSLRSGVGIDGLQNICRTVIFAELDWTPGVHDQCLSADTEILTPKGWQGVDDVNIGDQMAGFDLSNDEIRWVLVQKKIDRPLAPGEKIYSTHTEKIDVRVTGEHRMVSRRKTRKLSGVGRSSWEFVLSEDLSGKSRRFIPTSGFEDCAGVDLSDYELRLIGWYLGDGYFNGRSLTIYQAESQPWNEDIVKTLNGCGLAWVKHQHTNANGVLMNMYCIPKGVHHKWSKSEIEQLKEMRLNDSSYREIAGSMNRSEVAVMKKCLKIDKYGEGSPVEERSWRGWLNLELYLDKNLSPTLEGMTTHQLRQLIHGFDMADGARAENLKNTFRITNTNKTLMDRLQSLCVRHGFSANISTRSSVTKSGKPIYDIWISEGMEACLPRPERLNGFTECETIPGERVWCVSNELETIVTRRHGKVAVVGNCIGRVFRDGQKEPVTAVFLVAERGADPVMAETLGLKTAQLEGIRDPDKPVVEEKPSGDHIRKLAQRYLEKAGRKQVVQLPVAVEDEAKDEVEVEEE